MFLIIKQKIRSLVQCPLPINLTLWRYVLTKFKWVSKVLIYGLKSRLILRIEFIIKTN